MAVPTSAAVPSSTPSSSRLPAVSASDLLRELDSSGRAATTLSTGTQALDDILLGGFERGKIAELWGPSGAGKTAIALTAAVRLLRREEAVIWAACASPLSSARLKASLPQESLQHFQSTSPPSLTHLLAFIQHSIEHKVFTTSGLLVIDDLNTLVDFDYPRQNAYASSSESDARKWQAGRRSVILASIITALNKLANIHRLAVIVTNGCATSMRSIGSGPVLVPAVGGSEWENGVWDRLAVFQDFNGRFIALQKVHGVSDARRVNSNPVVSFNLSLLGLVLEDGAAPTSSASVMQIASPEQTRKRSFGEIADSEDEDEYGWEDFEGSKSFGLQTD
ncbi:hypothetical protein AMS68_006763 [Peltaster fructicola]|uniref:DNA repair protein RAD51 homolog 3 n=1 Tax=Peltaster fructicola TaxID=286661 RepID=A0A6H0Y2S4_9PEZI|nr:hypothetical protein AMS68_006763 [Peltaster fructicola]